jgi:hypothetical protein
MAMARNIILNSDSGSHGEKEFPDQVQYGRGI